MSLLASHNAGGGFLQHRIEKALASFYDTSVAGTQPVRVGPHRLIRELGRGGMGTVFLAERDDDEYYAQVAVKLVRPGMDTEFILARFRRERQTLARLQHPNISRLLDGGTTEHGLPYFVMEHRWSVADGLPPIAECPRRPAPDVSRRLFGGRLRASQFHHSPRPETRQHPRRSGVPKLVDFGICKLLRAGAISATDSAVAPMTPDYASPEQMRGDAVTPLSDIYSLGAVLHEPHRHLPAPLRQADAGRDRTDVAGRDCPSEHRRWRPGGRAPAQRRSRQHPDARARDRAGAAVPGAAELAEDLRRYLHHEPVHARPQTVRYRAVQIRPAPPRPGRAAAAVFVALSAGLAVSVREARIASSRQQQVRMMADKLVFDVHDAVRDLPGSTKARAVIVQTALHYLDASVTSVQGDGPAEKELAKRTGGWAMFRGTSAPPISATHQAHWPDIARPSRCSMMPSAALQAMSTRSRNAWCCMTASARFTPLRDSFVMPCRRWRKASVSAGHSPGPTTLTCEAHIGVVPRLQ